MATIHREFRLFAAPSRAIRCADKSPGDRMSVADKPPARHVLHHVPRLNDAHAVILNSVLHSRDG
jgi:hypothetical protein